MDEFYIETSKHGRLEFKVPKDMMPDNSTFLSSLIFKEGDTPDAITRTPWCTENKVLWDSLNELYTPMGYSISKTKFGYFMFVDVSDSWEGIPEFKINKK